jgi:hypothetical protein
MAKDLMILWCEYAQSNRRSRKSLLPRYARHHQLAGAKHFISGAVGGFYAFEHEYWA